MDNITEGTWVCPNDETINTGAACIICGLTRSAAERHCPKCGGNIAESDNFCRICGMRIQNSEAGNEKWTQRKFRKFGAMNSAGDRKCSGRGPAKKRGISGKAKILVVIGAIVILSIPILYYLLHHEWMPATCAEPETCTICGKTRGEPLEHSWTAATCCEPKTCLRCGAVDGAVGEHNWSIVADDSGIATCDVCGSKAKRLSELPSSTSEDTIDFGGTTGIYHQLNDTIENCIGLTLNVTVSDVEGDATGRWELNVRDENGNWTSAAAFDMNEDDFNHQRRLDLEFTEPKTFDAVFLSLRKSEQYSFSLQFSVTGGFQLVSGVSWNYDARQKTLTFFGYGDMTDYSIESPAQWSKYNSEATSIIISEGITAIGGYAFNSFTKLTSVRLPASVTRIGKGAFINCYGLKTVHYGGGADDWSAIEIGTLNHAIDSAEVYSVIRK